MTRKRTWSRRSTTETRTIANAIRSSAAIAAALALAACGGDSGRDNAAADSVAKIEQGQTDDARPEAPLPQPSPTDAAAPEPTNDSALTEPKPGEDVDMALAVARTYYRLIGEGDYRAAYNLWRGEGQASGMSARQFAESFERYASYEAEIGTPGRVDAGAGQRYIEIPVTVGGRLREGDRPFRMAGALILHRTAAIDGATQLDRRWRIHDSSIRPRPAEDAAEPVGQPNRAVALYRCEDGSRYRATFNNDEATVELVTGRRRLAVLDQQRSGSGISYAGEGYALRGKGTEADITFPTGNRKRCTSDP